MSITIEEIVKKINNGTLKYRLVTDTDESARGKVDLRNRQFTNKGRDIDNLLNFSDCSLEDADLHNALFENDMKNVNFEGAKLSHCAFDKCKLEGLFFINSYFDNVVLVDTSVAQSTFNNTNMEKIKYLGSIFTDCEIIECNMNNSEFEEFNYQDVNVTGCQMIGCNLTKCEITKSTFTGCIIENAKFVNTNLLLTGFYKKNEDDEVPYPLFKNSSFIDLTIDSCDLDELLFKNIEMSQVNAWQTTFDECIFDSFYISDCTFINGGFVKTRFKNPDRRQTGNNTIQNTDLRTIIFEGDIELEDIFIINIRDDNIRIDNPYQNIRENAQPPGNIGFYDRDEPEAAEDDEEDEEYDEAPEGLSNKDKCFWPYGPYDVKNTDYLKNPNHFLIQLPGSSTNYECTSLNDMKKTANLKEEFNLRENDYKGYYECSDKLMEKSLRTGITPLAFGPGDFNDAVEYVLFGTASRYYVRKPEWLWDGPIPEPKKFKLVQDSPDLKYFLSKSVVKYNGNVVSDTHCDSRDNGYVYRLEPILEGGKRVKKTNNKPNKKTIKKVKKNKKTVKKVKKNKITRKLKN